MLKITTCGVKAGVRLPERTAIEASAQGNKTLDVIRESCRTNTEGKKGSCFMLFYHDERGAAFGGGTFVSRKNAQNAQKGKTSRTSEE
jgi:hypothetical protein